jgi:hypothetical protein
MNTLKCWKNRFEFKEEYLFEFFSNLYGWD